MHNHDHSHGAHCHHVPNTIDKRFLIGIILNLGFVVAEIFYGLISHSLALVADAGHNFSDVIAMLLSWGAIWLAQKSATKRYTYGFKRASILASLANAMMLLMAIGIIAWEAIRRFQSPEAVATHDVIVVALIGIFINGATALMFHRDHHNDLNIKGVYLHMLADAAVSFGVVIGAVVIGVTGWQWLDPVMSLAIVLVIFIGTWSLLKESVHLAMDAAPAQINTDAVHDYLKTLPNVMGIHDLHIWALGTQSTALTAHLLYAKEQIDLNVTKEITHELRQRFNIDHATLQIETTNDCESCN